MVRPKMRPEIDLLHLTSAVYRLIGLAAWISEAQSMRCSKQAADDTDIRNPLPAVSQQPSSPLLCTNAERRSYTVQM
jgi:hypothetical protein